MKTFFRLTLAAALVAFAAATASAQVTRNLTINATVGARASLTLSVAAISFADADPDLTPSIPASATVNVSARTRTIPSTGVTVTIQALTNLVSGTDTIPAGQISWGASGDVTAGALSTAAQTIISGSGSGWRTGDMDFVLANSWTYAVGNYSTTVTYTLSAP